MRRFKPIPITSTIALAVWVVWLLLLGYQQAVAHVIQHWPITLTMVFGSMIAGGTSVGGGAVAFPVFTKLLHIVPHDAKVFSLAIQSVGMSAASITILFSGIRTDKRVIGWGSLGGVLGISLGLWWAPWLPADVLKMSFTVMLTSLAITLLILTWKQKDWVLHRHVSMFSRSEKCLVFGAGCFGGLMSGLLGNGIDVVLFAVMVLLFRISPKVATPTSVVLMAVNAVVGQMMQVWVFHDFSPTIQAYWVAAIPVVLVGAPLGALCCSLMRRSTITYLLVAIIGVECLTTMLLIPWRPVVAIASFFTFMVFSGLNIWMLRAASSIRPAPRTATPSVTP